ncbi:MAG TPA: hypothetical protein VIL35_04685 [Vicinamibacterales bacterium]
MQPGFLVTAFLILASASAPVGPGNVREEAPSPAARDAGTQAFRFATTRWGASPEETTRTLTQHGFTFEQAGEEGDLIFSGVLNGHPAVVIALFGEQGLSKILVSLPTDDGTTMETYREMRQLLGKAYGAPEIEVENYEYPFADGKHVGYEATALRVGKATIGALWKTNGESLGIKITEHLIVSAHYESPAWPFEAERRRN